MQPSQLRIPFRLQLIYLTLVAVWNGSGLILIDQRMRAPGPTASLSVVAFSLLLAGLLFVSRRSLPFLYLGISILMVYVAFTASWSAFTRDPALWPSDFWRYAGASLNGLGIVAGVWGVFGRWPWSPKRDRNEV